jgi:hypothetical protein
MVEPHIPSKTNLTLQQLMQRGKSPMDLTVLHLWHGYALLYHIKIPFLSSLQLEVPKCPYKLHHVYLSTHNSPKTMISGFCHGMNEIFALLGGHAALIGLLDP